ncbi:MAG TPA: TIGR02117 family protein [Burkholderiaceae bacterium]|nr:TIGR02117 family protein [Burkholderiaceae bacterium]
MRRGWRAAGLLVAALLAPFAIYLLCALVLGVLPRNADFREDPQGVAIYVRTNGVHADLVVPTRHGAIDWSLDFPAARMRSRAAPSDWIAFGWGDRGFMLQTPTWADLKSGTAFVALTGSGSGAMHVEYVETPAAYRVVRVSASEAQYAQLAAYIRAAFERDAAGRARRIDAPGYFDSDAFYEALPRYSAWHTCNEWTRRGLTLAGVRTPVWSPFDTAIFFQLGRIKSASAAEPP